MTKKINPFDEMLEEGEDLLLPMSTHIKKVVGFTTLVMEEHFQSEQRSLSTLMILMMGIEGWEGSELGDLLTSYASTRMKHIEEQRGKLMEENDMLKISMKEVVVH